LFTGLFVQLVVRETRLQSHQASANISKQQQQQQQQHNDTIIELLATAAATILRHQPLPDNASFIFRAQRARV